MKGSVPNDKCSDQISVSSKVSTVKKEKRERNRNETHVP